MKVNHTGPMTTTAPVYCIPTAQQAQLLTVAVDSSAIARLGIVIDNDNIPHLLVIFNSNTSKVYRYIFEDDLSSGAARRWFELLNDDDAKSATSWGQLFNRALKHGDIEPIEV
jgi:sorbitol-specific phosphotransferase system component IIBC